MCSILRLLFTKGSPGCPTHVAGRFQAAACFAGSWTSSQQTQGSWSIAPHRWAAAESLPRSSAPLRLPSPGFSGRQCLSCRRTWHSCEVLICFTLDYLPVQEYFKSVKPQSLGHPVYTMRFPGAAAVCCKSLIPTSFSAICCCCRACYLCQTGQVTARQTKTSVLSFDI